ncbi:iron chelate uptake ABC transporter family permease subunit [Lysinibacter sp. HNR]|uniref:ABC transporter permease n=1 Tax=Lysinibacter sp. HNR TaxID=3031408 RepID=UPI002434D565|nr:iron chelate uptake ABC transporter family permease subunit [Lysinibacter sp. HNR]WGD36715.1 iron chelate uptake ABC transporter family permease subunit [Lysinibacter sp. HNR]
MAASPYTDQGRPRHSIVTRGNRRVVLGITLVVVVALVVVSLFVGGYDITVSQLLHNPEAREMFFISRVPRTLAIIFAAVAMSVSGVIMQLITQNRFVEPTTAGTSQWAGLGVLVALLFVPGATPLFKMIIATAFAFCGTLVFIFLLRRVAAKGVGQGSILIPLVGIMLGAVVGAAMTFIASETQLLQSMSAWSSGGFSGVVRGFYEPLWAVVVIAVLAYILANRFTAAGLGKALSTNLGMNYELTVLIGVSMVALATGVTSVVVGFIPFLGLIVPNAVSVVLGDDMRRNLPWVAVVSIGLMLVCDLIGRVVVAPMEIPVSVILGAVGAVLFIALVLRQRKYLSA